MRRCRTSRSSRSPPTFAPAACRRTRRSNGDDRRDRRSAPRCRDARRGHAGVLRRGVARGGRGPVDGRAGEARRRAPFRPHPRDDGGQRGTRAVVGAFRPRGQRHCRGRRPTRPARAANGLSAGRKPRIRLHLTGKLRRMDRLAPSLRTLLAPSLSLALFAGGAFAQTTTPNETLQSQASEPAPSTTVAMPAADATIVAPPAVDAPAVDAPAVDAPAVDAPEAEAPAADSQPTQAEQDYNALYGTGDAQYADPTLPAPAQLPESYDPW